MFARGREVVGGSSAAVRHHSRGFAAGVDLLPEDHVVQRRTDRHCRGRTRRSGLRGFAFRGAVVRDHHVDRQPVRVPFMESARTPPMFRILQGNRALTARAPPGWSRPVGPSLRPGRRVAGTLMFRRTAQARHGYGSGCREARLQAGRPGCDNLGTARCAGRGVCADDEEVRRPGATTAAVAADRRRRCAFQLVSTHEDRTLPAV